MGYKENLSEQVSFKRLASMVALIFIEVHSCY